MAPCKSVSDEKLKNIENKILCHIIYTFPLSKCTIISWSACAWSVHKTCFPPVLWCHSEAFRAPRQPISFSRISKWLLTCSNYSLQNWSFVMNINQILRENEVTGVNKYFSAVYTGNDRHSRISRRFILTLNLDKTMPIFGEYFAPTRKINEFQRNSGPYFLIAEFPFASDWSSSNIILRNAKYQLEKRNPFKWLGFAVVSLFCTFTFRVTFSFGYITLGGLDCEFSHWIADTRNGEWFTDKRTGEFG